MFVRALVLCCALASATCTPVAQGADGWPLVSTKGRIHEDIMSTEGKKHEVNQAANNFYETTEVSDEESSKEITSTTKTHGLAKGSASNVNFQIKNRNSHASKPRVQKREIGSISSLNEILKSTNLISENRRVNLAAVLPLLHHLGEMFGHIGPPGGCDEGNCWQRSSTGECVRNLNCLMGKHNFVY
ncbi:metal responsive transcript [Hyalella azteca]|uniref:Metal responsive transcript n=1 Tax=Hyalella azteca TaxID=294128 RepID=A0A6A0GVH1_HYAAZ|nr:uncharacterized protein LOC108683374 [Hyalella azteca]KAA0189632.1 metal responsive transcript [Hyalella azteca]